MADFSVFLKVVYDFFDIFVKLFEIVLLFANMFIDFLKNFINFIIPLINVFVDFLKYFTIKNKKKRLSSSFLIIHPLVFYFYVNVRRCCMTVVSWRLFFCCS